MSPEEIGRMSYVDLMAFLGEVNRPPGGKDSIRQLVQNTFINTESVVLDVGCNTGYCSLEIALLAKCHVIGVDVNENMVNEANRQAKGNQMINLIRFQVADGMDLPFPDSNFDVVMSGGSTAFIDDKKRALQEYSRVTKPWGFVADINFYYKKHPPQILLDKINNLLDINIQPWDEKYWLSLYDQMGLEKYYVYTNSAQTATPEQVNRYCESMAKTKNLKPGAHKVLVSRLREVMLLFSKNNSYLNYGVFIYRNRPSPEQISLFGT